MLYAYYADFLIGLGRKQEGDLARKHASILKRTLEKKENGAGNSKKELSPALANNKSYQSEFPSKELSSRYSYYFFKKI